MPLLHQPPTLTIACLTTIARNFEFLVYGVKHRKDMAAILEDDTYLSFQGPFQHMPSAILEKALWVIENESSIRHVRTRHLHVLLQPQLESLKLTFGSGDTHKALELLQQRCKRLRRLTISDLRTVEPTLLVRLTPHLTMLVHLDLSHTETSDSVLAAIGFHCPLLRELNISFCPVSGKALEKLFWDGRRRVKMCPLVTSVNLTGCQVSPVTIRTGLQLQPTLRHAEFENNLLAFDPNFSGLWEEGLMFSLLGLSAESVDVSDVTMDSVTSLCPYVTSLSLSGCNISNDSLIRAMTWENLTQLQLTNTEKETIHFGESVLPILTARGHQMTALLLSRFTYVDIVAIATTCPSLENLALSNITLFEPVLMGPRDDFFKQLQALEIWSDLSTTTLTGAVLRLLLGSCQDLHNLLVSGCEQLTDLLLAELWADNNPMKELSRLTIDSCPHFSMLSLEQLFDMRNALSCVRVWNCPNITKDHERALFRKIAQENMDVFFEWYAWTG